MTRNIRRALPLFVAGLMGVGAVSLAPPAAADSLSFGASADTFVTSSAPTADRGGDDVARVDDGGKTALFAFDVAGIPAGATGVSGVLTLRGVGTQPTRVVDIHQVGNSWTESTNWNNRPTLGAEVDSDSIGASVTRDFQVPISGNGTVSFAVDSQDSAGDSFVGTRENATSANRPKLTVNYTAGGTPPPPTDPAASSVTSAAFAYTGTWLNGSATNEKYTSVAGNTATIEATVAAGGGTVALRGVKGASFGYADVSIDGGAAQRVDLYNSSRQENVAWFTSPTLSAGTHLIKVTVVGQKQAASANTFVAIQGADNSNGTLATPGTTPPPPPPAEACGDGVDNDGDGKIDYPADPGCTSATDTDETDPVTPPPANEPPTVNAGPDQTITLPDNNAALDATVNDPDSAETVQWTGPAGVTFANATSVDTVATFPSAGTYDLRLTANDGFNPAVSDVVRVVVNPEVVTPPPPPPAGDTIRSISMSRAKLMSLPTSGTQWQRIVTMANQSFDFSPVENNPEGGGNVVAGAVVAIRTNNSTMAAKVNAALDKFQNTAPSAYTHAGFNREGVGYVQAGEIMGRNTSAWRNILTRHMTEPHSADNGSDFQAILEQGALRGSNNHHSAAFQTYAAIIAALNDTARANDACASAKAFLGGPHNQNGGWGTKNEPRPDGRFRGTQDEPAAQTWYTNVYAGINPGDPAQSIRNGAMPGDVHRDGGAYPNPGSKGIEQYIFGSGFRFAGGAISMNGMGCTGLFTYADSAFKRMRQWIDIYGVDPTNHHAHGDNLLEYIYGQNFSSAGGVTTASGESALVIASWLGEGDPTWLR